MLVTPKSGLYGNGGNIENALKVKDKYVVHTVMLLNGINCSKGLDGTSGTVQVQVIVVDAGIVASDGARGNNGSDGKTGVNTSP
ncbi:MAG: hypothetical protein LBE09_08315 [Christensenellaceae bacterium]|jgi:hypothetical protein|nr:hypothetical protein [Christensenellaceae bacterium]